MLNMKAQKQVTSRWLFYKGRNLATFLPVVMQKVEHMPNEGADLAKEISKQNVKDAPLFLLATIVKCKRRQINGKEDC